VVTLKTQILIFKSHRLSFAFCTSLLTALPVSVFGMSGAEATDRPSSRPTPAPKFLPSEPPSNFSLPPVPPAEPNDADDSERTFRIESYVFEGHTVFSTEELQSIAQPFTERAVSIADLEELRQRLTRHYVDRGYINSGAIVPPDPLRDGVFHFQIVEGGLEQIHLKGQGWLREGYIKNRLMRSAGPPLNIDELQERFQWLLGDPLIERMNGRILPGASPGRSILDIEVTRARPYQFSLFGNNYRPPSIGAEAGGANTWIRNLTGLGDFLNLSFTMGEGSTRYFGSWSLPINDQGTQIYFQFDEGDSSVIEEPINDIDVKSKVHNLEGGISHPLIDTLKRRLAFGSTLAVRENETRLLGGPFSFIQGLDSARNQTTVLRFFQDFTERWEKQALALRSTFSVGLGALGSTPEKNPNDPDSEFFAWLGQAQYVHRVLSNGAQVVFRADVQVSDDPLLPLEQIAVGGVGSVRGYRENQLVRDQGYSGSIEFHYPLYSSSSSETRQQFVLIPFMDYGEAWNHGQDSSTLHSVGIGFNWTFYNLHSEFFWAHPIKSPPIRGHGNLQDDGVHFQVRLDAF
jgi:hemolysin activation/secretion protein